MAEKKSMTEERIPKDVSMIPRIYNEKKSMTEERISKDVSMIPGIYNYITYYGKG